VISAAMPKRYLVFGYDQYYPGGGWSDFVGASDTPEGAEKLIAEDENHCDFYETIDLAEKGIINA